MIRNGGDGTSIDVDEASDDWLIHSVFGGGGIRHWPRHFLGFFWVCFFLLFVKWAVVGVRVARAI